MPLSQLPIGEALHFSVSKIPVSIVVDVRLQKGANLLIIV